MTTLRDRYLYALANKCADCGGVEGVRCEWVSDDGGYDVPCINRQEAARRRARRDFLLALLAIPVALVLAALIVSAALAHDEAAWIDDGGYVGPGGVKCCGPNDCGPVDVRKIVRGRLPGELIWLPTLEKIGRDRIVGHSPDGRWWRCRVTFVGGPEDHQQTRCLFPPAPGS